MFFFFKQKTAYDVRIIDWSSDVCSSDLQSTLSDRRYRWRWPQAAACGSRSNCADAHLRNQARYTRGRAGGYFHTDRPHSRLTREAGPPEWENRRSIEIGRASCRERVGQYV